MNRHKNKKETGKGYCWIIVLLVGFASFFTYFHRMSASVIRTDLTEAFGLSATSFATFSSVCFYPYMLMQLPVGLLADSWGVRKTVSLGCLVTAAGTLLFSTADSFVMACIGRALVGFGISTPVVCTQKITAAWFPAHKTATASALAGTIGNFGALCAQTPLALLVGYLGWRASFGSAGVVTLLFALLCFLFLKDQPEGDKYSRIPVTPQRKRQSLTAVLRQIFTNKRILVLLVLMFVQMGIYQMFSGTWGISYLCDVFGYTSLEASGFTSWMMVGMMTFYLLMPVLSDQIKRRKILLVLVSGLTLVVWGMITYGSAYLQNRLALTVFFFLMGATSSTFPLMFSLIREYSDPACIGTAVGSCNMIGMAAGALFPVFCGKIIDGLSGSGIAGAAIYSRAFTFAVVLAAIAFLASLFTTETNCRNISKYNCSEQSKTSGC